MSALTITTLGEPAIVHNGAPCPFPIRKVLALALYLAVTNQSHPRTRLTLLLWPDADEAHGQTNLRQVLLRLRQAIGGDAQTHLQTPGNLVRLTLGTGGVLDVTRLLDALSPQSSLAERLAALQAYRGTFLQHLDLPDAPEFMAWVVGQQAYWAGCYDLLAERVLRQLLDEGQSDAAGLVGHHWMQQHPDNEMAYRLCATAQAQSGDVGAAQLTLATAAHHFAELGLALSGETHAVTERLALLPAPCIAPQPILRLPLVGRAEGFAQLRQTYAQAIRGQTQGVLVLGEAGLGKSRLVEVFSRWAAVQGADVAVGHAYELSGRWPYQALMELLRGRLAREHAPDDVLDDSWLVELQRLVPELHDRYPDLSAPVDDAAAGTRLLEAITQLGIALARQHPLVWVVEDLHWADDATRDSLLYLLQRWRAARVPALVVVTCRSAATATDATLAAWVALGRRSKVQEITLAPLTTEQMTNLLMALLSETISQEVCQELAAATLGNPLYMHHVVLALIERGMIGWQGQAPRLVTTGDIPSLADWLPGTLQALLMQSIQQLDPLTQQVLAAAAIIGTPFNEEVVVPVIAADEAQVLIALEQAERSLLIRTDGRHYHFTHATVAEAIVADLTPARRRVLHRRALAALEAQGAAPPPELARHALGAQAWEKAVAYVRQAAVGADHIGAHRDALYWYEQLAHLLRTPVPASVWHRAFPVGEIAHLFERRANLYRTLGDKDQADQVLADLLAFAHQHNSRILEAHALIVKGQYVLQYDGDVAAAHEIVHEARQVTLQGGTARTVLRLENLRTEMAVRQEDLTTGWQIAQRLVAVTRRGTDAFHLAQGLYTFSEVAMRSGRWDTACVAMEESVPLFAAYNRSGRSGSLPPTAPHLFEPLLDWSVYRHSIRDLLHRGVTSESSLARQWGSNGLVQLGVNRLHVGDGQAGHAALQMAWQIFTERHEQRFHYHYLLERTFGLLEAGAMDDAAQIVEATLAASCATEERLIDATHVASQCAQADRHMALFQLVAAHESLTHATAYAVGKPSWDRLLPATRQCTLAALLADWHTAYDAACHAQTVRAAAPTQLTWFDFARYYETEALVRAGERDRAVADAEELAAALGTNRRYRLVWLHMQAVLARHADNHQAACQNLTEALDLARAMDLPREIWHITQELAATYRDLEEDDHAEAMRHSAEQGIMQLADQITDPVLHADFMAAALALRPALR